MYQSHSPEVDQSSNSPFYVIYTSLKNTGNHKTKIMPIIMKCKKKGSLLMDLTEHCGVHQNEAFNLFIFLDLVAIQNP